MIKTQQTLLNKYLNQEELYNIQEDIKIAHNKLHNKTGAGNDFLGWLDYGSSFDKDEFNRIKKAGKKIQNNSQVLVVIGIGGSYLGARAVIDSLGGMFFNLDKKFRDGGVEIIYAGHTLSSHYINSLLKYLSDKDFSVNIISKSGTTIEPAVAFRVLKRLLESKYGEQEASKRIYVTTDKAKGALKQLADTMSYETFVVPDDVGGRFSFITAVGLLPISAAGFNIDSIMQGYIDATKAYSNDDLFSNECYKYAAIRSLLHKKGKDVEILVSYDIELGFLAEWYKQLFGESEGKDNKGIFPTAMTFTTDLHSLGQYVQDGKRVMFETVLNVKNPKSDLELEKEDIDSDGLNYLAGKTISYINSKAFEGTSLAHSDGGVPCIILDIDKIDEYSLGFLMYFFMKACGMSAYLNGVNPFNQPGVEEYKHNMLALLGKKGLEKEKEALRKRISEMNK